MTALQLTAMKSITCPRIVEWENDPGRKSKDPEEIARRSRLEAQASGIMDMCFFKTNIKNGKRGHR